MRRGVERATGRGTNASRRSGGGGGMLLWLLRVLLQVLLVLGVNLAVLLLLLLAQDELLLEIHGFCALTRQMPKTPSFTRTRKRP